MVALIAALAVPTTYMEPTPRVIRTAGPGVSSVTATVTSDKGEAGITVVSSKLKVVAEGLQGIEKAQFPEFAREAEGKCPISNALRGSLKIEVEAEAK